MWIDNLDKLTSLNLELKNNEIEGQDFEELWDELKKLEWDVKVYIDIRNNRVEDEYKYYEKLEDDNVELIFVGLEKRKIIGN